MDLPLHAIEARINGARKDLPTVFGRLRMLAGHFRRAMDRGTDKTEQNPKQNMEGGKGREWFGRIRVTEFHTRLYAIYHWTDSATGVHAIQFCEQGPALVFGPHFWKQYGDRHKNGREHLYLMREYFQHNAHITFVDQERLIKGKPGVAGITEHGLALGHIETPDITVCNTYVDKTDLRDDKKDLHFRSLVHHRMRDMSPEVLLNMKLSYQESLVAIEQLLKAA